MRRLRRARMAKTGASDPMEVLNPDLARKLGFLDKAQKPGMAFTSERSRHCQLLERSVLLDGVEMLAHSAAASEVEVRFPFMDVRLIEYCLSLPSNQKFRDGYTRFVMHNGMAGVLPDKIKRRPGKSNLTPSFGKGLLKFERDNLRMIILSEASQLTAFVNLERIKACLDRFQRGTGSPNDITAVWNTVGLAMWLRARHAGAK
jgi:asparagine synthase (glutamine-hydrolysing)